MQIYEEITPQEVKQEQQEVLPTVQKTGTPLIVVQSVLCLLVLLAALVLKYVLPMLYEDARSWYDAEMARSVLITYDNAPNL